MGLFDNVGSLVNLFVDDKQAPESQNLAKRADVNPLDFGKVASLGLPAILKAIQQNTQDEAGLESFDKALEKHQDVQNYQSVEQLSENVDPQDGDKILGHVFNDKESIIDRIADSVGMTPAAVKRVLVLLAPVVLKYLADQKKSKNLDKKDLQKETANIADSVTKTITDSNKGGLLGSLLSNLTSDDATKTSKDKERKSGILGDVFKKMF